MTRSEREAVWLANEMGHNTRHAGQASFQAIKALSGRHTAWWLRRQGPEPAFHKLMNDARDRRGPDWMADFESKAARAAG